MVSFYFIFSYCNSSYLQYILKLGTSNNQKHLTMLKHKFVKIPKEILPVLTGNKNFWQNPLFLKRRFIVVEIPWQATFVPSLFLTIFILIINMYLIESNWESNDIMTYFWNKIFILHSQTLQNQTPSGPKMNALFALWFNVKF